MHNTAPRKRKRGAPAPWMLVPMAALYTILYRSPLTLGEFAVYAPLALVALLPPFVLGWAVGWGVGRLGNDPA
jgi:hypothetical protein